MADVIAPYLVYIVDGQTSQSAKSNGLVGSVDALKRVYSLQDVKRRKLQASKLRTRLFSEKSSRLS